MPVGVVAAVGERTLTIAELREHVIAEATRQQKVPDPCAKSTTCPEPPDLLARRVIDERIGQLVAQEHAARTGVRVTNEEIQAELDRIVLFEFRPKEEVLKAAKDQGYTDLRKTIGERVLLTKVWAAGPGKDPLPEIDTEAKRKAVLEAAYDRWKVAPEHQFVELRALAFHAPTKELVAYTTDSLTKLRRRAEAGEDFCALIKTYGNNDSERNSCGTLGPLPITLFPPELQKLIATMKPLVIAGPVPFQQVAMALFQITDVPRPRPLEHVSRELWDKTVSEIQDRAIAAWLKRLEVTYGLRTAAPDLKDIETYVVDVRRKVPPLDTQAARQQTWVREVVRNIVIKP
jgi:parvulin-like peptidyl-prolyl isomerase